MINTLTKFFYKNGYLLIIAAWLYTISFIFSHYWFYSSSPERVKSKLEAFLKSGEQKFETFTKDSAVLNVIINKGFEPKKALDYINEDAGLFAYTRDSSGALALAFWNNNKVLPENKDLESPDGKYFSEYSNGQFEFIKKTFFLNGREVVAAAVIPIHWNYFFKNKYLQSGFPAIEGIETQYKIVASDPRFYIKNGDGKVLFGLKQIQKIPDENPGGWSITLRILSVIFILIFLNNIAYDIGRNKGWLKGFIFLASVIVFFRFLSYVFPFPFRFRNRELFDPSIYASNTLHPSLGDLFINIILLFWLISYIKFAAIKDFRKVKKITGKKGWLLTALLTVFLIVISFTSAGIIRSLIVDSKISFDVTNFFSLNIYSLLSFIILCFIILTFFHLSHIVLLFINKCATVPAYAKFLLAVVFGLLYLSLNIDDPATPSNLIVLIWLLLYILILQFRKEDIFIPILRSSYFLIWLIFFAGSISALIIYENHYVEFEQRIRIAEKLAIKTDPYAETLMSVGLTTFTNSFLSANFDRFTNESSNKIIKDSLINEKFSGFINKYNTRLYTYDQNFHPLYNEDSVSFDVIYSIILNRSKKTANSDLYYYENESNVFNFIYQKEIRDSVGKILGYFFVVAEPKKYESEALYPELFKQVKDVEADLELNYAYAVYSNGQIISNYGDYNFVTSIPKSLFLKQDYKEEKKDDNTELWYNAGNNRLVIIVKSDSHFFEAITLFAYLFVSFLFIIVLFETGYFLVKNKFSLQNLTSVLKPSIRNQVQGTIIFISVFSFLVIGVATISFYINRFNQTNHERLVKAIQVMANEVQSQITNHEIFDNAEKNYDLGTNSRLEKTIKEISDIHNVDVNFYDINGNLVVSTQPYIYKKQILSEMMEPVAFYRLHYNNYIKVIQEEKVSSFSFLSIYMPVKDESGKPYAYLNVPYLNSQKELNQEISNFLVTLINLNAFIFVIAGAISVLLTNRITKSFTLIGSKMKEINLGKANEKIVWNNNDEIGALVNEYNTMVKKLENSAHALAKSEREGAWREMARQVAHEIKNPLTPMKLSIQYLQRAIQEKNPNAEALSEKVSATLVEQIDQLAEIASDFSQFANISNVKTQRFDVTELLNSLIHLYSTNEKLNITYHNSGQKACINADRTQINRLFTNLFQNAIEASDDEKIIQIIISQTINSGDLLIDICDLGSGISIEKQENIFTPNFTTKSSGTGLGLAICKGIVEKANGRIWFDTMEGKGTTFHIMLPLVT